MRLSITPQAKWLSPRWLGVKYGMSRKMVKKWIEGQGRDCYRLTIMRTPAGLRIFDPQLELPPNQTAEPEQMFIFRAREIAALLGVTKRAVNLMASEGRIRFRMYGNKHFFPVSEARRLFAERGKLSKSGQGNFPSPVALC